MNHSELTKGQKLLWKHKIVWLNEIAKYFPPKELQRISMKGKAWENNTK